MSAKSRTERWYDENSDVENRRLDDGWLEFEVTKHVIQSCAEKLGLKKGRFLDVGGGPGRYAIDLARSEHTVVLSDLSSGNLELARTKAKESGVELDGFIHANALDIALHPTLSASCSRFDIVLCLGPMYHLPSYADRTQALENCIVLAKPGGYILAAFVTVYAHLRDVARREPGRLANEWAFYSRYLEHGKYERNTNMDMYHMYPENLDEDLRGVEGKVEVERVVSCEGFLGFGVAKELAKLTDGERRTWVDVVMRSADRMECRNSADHLLVVMRKK
ncbi:S-adenosyl-L-methionine-dependent methyltransferase [Aaosphaeria arxii CBS 175.79]|uniref:S-adenosyl-L-methionine-dependent methyltransferase n=1 Tax=Aaosphaeria arxii CBS 175.79 TaxID=1450172 RepID=A0A6A5YB54_9PLEO|nr:S-adenosyl-L-methionine-dependent methyltransferase [Aaosphaeria arxii CBS 175.79]KAF2022000.1 S-adenosyl-L-methionine-dependent methyltransferase [Aaosphaeria arxii CBS 175.79]